MEPNTNAHTILNNPPEIHRAGDTYDEQQQQQQKTTITVTGKKIPQSSRYDCFVCGLSSYPSIDVCVYLFYGIKA